jgi:hypothetical protein
MYALEGRDLGITSSTRTGSPCATPTELMVAQCVGRLTPGPALLVSRSRRALAQYRQRSGCARIDLETLRYQTD